jgi:trehalose 6-phosphate phosphatase
MSEPPDAVAALLSDPGSALLALDFDGTLAPIVDRPEDARPAPGAIEVLRRLAARLGRLAVVTGRPAAEVVRLGTLSDIPGLRVLGHYGLQRWQDGQLETPAPDPGVERARLALPELLAGAPRGVTVEDKEHSVAVHTRGTASPQQTLDELVPALWRLADEAGLEAVPGKFVLELRPPGVDKGSALRALVEEVAATTVVYVGDDVGDLPAFRAVAQLRQAGTITGLAVAAIDYPSRPGTSAETAGAAEPNDASAPTDPGRSDDPLEALRAAADLVLPGPGAVVAWLAGIADMLG